MKTKISAKLARQREEFDEEFDQDMRRLDETLKELDLEFEAQSKFNSMVFDARSESIISVEEMLALLQKYEWADLAEREYMAKSFEAKVFEAKRNPIVPSSRKYDLRGKVKNITIFVKEYYLLWTAIFLVNFLVYYFLVF